MSVQLYVVKSQLGTAADALERAANTLESEIDQVNRTANNLSTMWEGESHDKFMAQHERYQQLDRQLLEMTRSMIDAARMAREVYTDTDDEMARYLRGH